ARAALLERSRSEPLALSSLAPAAAVLRTGEVELFDASGPISSIVAPLRARGVSIGSIAFGRHAPRPLFEPDDVVLVVEVARHAALAVDNARLYAETRRAHDLQRALARANEILAESLDLEATLDRVARAAVPDLADSCG